MEIEGYNREGVAMIKKILTVLTGIIGAFLGGFAAKNSLDKAKENSTIKKVIKKYNKIDKEKDSIDGEELLLSGISSESPEKPKNGRKNKKNY